jgi:hypothetical protein
VSPHGRTCLTSRLGVPVRAVTAQTSFSPQNSQCVAIACRFPACLSACASRNQQPPPLHSGHRCPTRAPPSCDHPHPRASHVPAVMAVHAPWSVACRLALVSCAPTWSIPRELPKISRRPPRRRLCALLASLSAQRCGVEWFRSNPCARVSCRLLLHGAHAPPLEDALPPIWPHHPAAGPLASPPPPAPHLGPLAVATPASRAACFGGLHRWRSDGSCSTSSCTGAPRRCRACWRACSSMLSAAGTSTRCLLPRRAPVGAPVLALARGPSENKRMGLVCVCACAFWGWGGAITPFTPAGHLGARLLLRSAPR